MAWEHVVDAMDYLNIDLSRLLNGSVILRRLNSVLAALKPLAAVLLKAWCATCRSFLSSLPPVPHCCRPHSVDALIVQRGE
eukprot:4452033-Prymnesium_polylepis.1